MATASDYDTLGQRSKSLETLDWGMHVVGRLPSADLLAMAAGLYEQSGRRDEARQLLARALEIDPRNAKGLKLVEKLRP